MVSKARCTNPDQKAPGEPADQVVHILGTQIFIITLRLFVYFEILRNIVYLFWEMLIVYVKTGGSIF